MGRHVARKQNGHWTYYTAMPIRDYGHIQIWSEKVAESMRQDSVKREEAQEDFWSVEIHAPKKMLLLLALFLCFSGGRFCSRFRRAMCQHKRKMPLI